MRVSSNFDQSVQYSTESATNNSAIVDDDRSLDQRNINQTNVKYSDDYGNVLVTEHLTPANVNEPQIEPNFNELKNEAIQITNMVVEKAKIELSKQQQHQQEKLTSKERSEISVEISDEDLVEKEDRDELIEEYQLKMSQPVSDTKSQPKDSIETEIPVITETFTTSQSKVMADFPKELKDFVVDPLTESFTQIDSTDFSKEFAQNIVNPITEIVTTTTIKKNVTTDQPGEPDIIESTIKTEIREPSIEKLDQLMDKSTEKVSENLEPIGSSITPQSKSPIEIIDEMKESVELSKEMISSSESFQQLSETSRTSSSRPTSSEFDLTIIPEISPSQGSTEYVTCASNTNTRDLSFVTVPTSQETSYFTARSNISGKTSSNSLDVGELSSEASETIVIGDDDHLVPKSEDEYEFEEQYQRTNLVNTDAIEPFNCDIPTSILRTTVTTITSQPGRDNWEMVHDGERSESANHSVVSSEDLSPIADPTNGKKLTESFVMLDDGTQSPDTMIVQHSTDTPGEDFTYLEYSQNAFNTFDKNLYTHVEEDEDEDNIDGKKNILSQSSPLKLISIKSEAETSSTSSSLREFERLESEVFKDRTDWSQSSADFSVDSRSIEANKPEKSSLDGSILDASLCEVDENNESLNSEMSQDTVTCIIKNESPDQLTSIRPASPPKPTKLSLSKSLDVERKSTTDTKKIDESEIRIRSADNVDTVVQQTEQFQYTQSKDLSQLDPMETETMISSMTESFEHSIDERSVGPMLVSLKESFTALPDSSDVMLSNNLTTTNVHRGQRLLMDHDDPSSEELDCYCTDHRQSSQ
ncbi:hypothetical protein BLOT_003681 [Blomia tropicalis]|nr:hypothetical protein BLOT_003681 [Blomia tropicalis]